MRKFKLISTSVLGLIVVVVGAWVVWEYTRPSPAPKQPTAAYYSPDVPSEEPVPVTHKTNAKADEPNYIHIHSIGAAGYIDKVGVDQHKQVGVPSNIYIAGWFADASKPGQPGLSIIDGHVDGLNKPGIFKDIDQLKSGDIITITLGDGSDKDYMVMAVTMVDTDKAPSVIFSQNPGVTSQLNLVTCGGTFDDKSGHYKQRVVVSSKLVNS